MDLKTVTGYLKTIDDYSKKLENLEIEKIVSLKQTKFIVLNEAKININNETYQNKELINKLNNKSIELGVIISRLIKHKKPFFNKELQEVKNNILLLQKEIESNINKLQSEELNPVKGITNASLNMKTKIMKELKFVEKIFRDTGNGWVVEESERRNQIEVELKENLKLLKKLNELTLSLKITPKKEITLY